MKKLLILFLLVSTTIFAQTPALVGISHDAGVTIPDIDPPVYLSSVVEDASPWSLVITYGEVLDESSVPATTDFTVGDTFDNIVTNVSISGATITLALTDIVQNGQSVFLDYTKGANPIQDANGNESVNLLNESVTNNTAIDYESPVVTFFGGSNIATTSITLTGTATDNVGVEEWEIYLDGGFQETITEQEMIDGYVFGGLTAGTNYDIYAIAYDWSGNWTSSSTINFTTLSGLDTEDPVITQQLTFDTVTNTTVKLYAAATDNVGVDHWEIRIDGSWDSNSSDTETLDHLLTGLSPSTTYSIVVEPYDAAGNNVTSTAAIVTTIATPTGIPILSNFAVSNTLKDRVTFDSDKSITGMTATGFVISGKTLDTSVDGDGLVIDGDGLGGYFAVTVDFTWWDNNTIRLGENSSATNVNNKVNNFTLSYIDNLIDEPTATDENLYVTNTASGGTGTEVSPYTFAEAIANASAGTTIWVKAGNYTGIKQDITFDGTATNPIKIIGYKTNPTENDITTNYYETYGTTWDNDEMPTLTALANNVYSYVLRFNSANYIIVKNIQFKDGSKGFEGYSASNYLHFERINGDNGAGNATRADSCFQFEETTDTSNFSHIRLIDSRIDNGGITSIIIRGGGYSLIDNVKSHTDSNNEDYSDYLIQIGGSNNIVRDCFVESHHINKSSLHGIGLRSSDWTAADYNLFENNTAINVQEGLYIRNSNANYNVIKDSYAGNDGYPYDNDRGGIYVYGCGDYNIFERIHVDSCDYAIGFKDDGTEGVDPPVQSVGEYNIIRNCLITNSDNAISFSGDADFNSVNNNNSILNCTFDNNTYMLYEGNAFGSVSNFNMKKNIITNTSSGGDSGGDISEITFSSNVFYDNGTWDDTIINSNGNVSVDPIYQAAGDWTPTQTFSLIDVAREPFVLEDYSRLERNATLTTAGAILHASETP